MLVDVIVDVQIWGLNKPLTYSVPSKFEERAAVGSVVRVALRGRRVRGWVVRVHGDEPPQSVLPIASISGAGPVFDQALLDASRALARQYVHPLSSFLSLFTPPRLGRPRTLVPRGRSYERPAPQAQLWRPGAAEDAVARYIELIDGWLREGTGAIVTVPEVREGSRIIDALTQRFDEEVAVVHSGQDPADRSKALWQVAFGERRVVLGGRAALFAPALPLGGIIVHDEHDDSYKDQRSPYYDARVVAVERARATGAQAILVSSTPSLTSFAAAEAGRLVMVEPERGRERAGWPAVELLEPPARGMPQRAVAAIIEAKRRGARSMVLLPRVKSTASGPGPENVVSFVSRVVPGASVARADRPGLGNEPGVLAQALQADVVVATEAALADIERPPVAAAIALSVDSYFKRPSGRAAEDAFASLWRFASFAAGQQPRGHVLLETTTPDHHVIQALTRGDYSFFARREMQTRVEMSVPPAMSLIRVGIRDDESAGELVERISQLPGVSVLGPVPGSIGLEVLIKVADAQTVVEPLGSIVAGSGDRMHVEVAPRDW